ncbi:MAG: TRAP transporter fused permease subunit [Rhizobiaceae bacterium]
MTGLLALLFSVGARRRPSGTIGWVSRVLALGTTCYVLYAALWLIMDPLILVAVFLALILSLLFLVVSHRSVAKDGNPPFADILASLASLATGVYFLAYGDDLVQRISLLDPLTPADIIIGSLICLLTLEATRRTVGLGLTLLVIMVVAYNLFGHQLTGILEHGYISYEHFLDQTVYTTNGVFGAPLRVAATYAFLFVLFGTLLEKTGGSNFFFKIAAAVSGRQIGGPAKVSVFSSALYGTISGSPTSDVVTTGSVTIPMMRRLGYPRSVAGAIEVASSPSGGLLPPVMGSAAFIMVEITGIPYVDIATAAILPAFLLLLGIFVQVHYYSSKMGIGRLDPAQIPSVREAVRDGWLFVLPLIAIVGALTYGFSISLVATIGLATVLAVASLREETRPNLAGIADTLIVAAYRMVPVAAACAAAGLVVGGISMTGLSGKLALGIYSVAGESTLVALVISGVIAILLGMGMPTPSAYIMSAVLTAPTLIDLGIPVLNVHFFLLFFAVLSAITPPVAVAAYAAASLAEANPIAIATRACGLAAPAFFIPFVFVYQPALLGDGSMGAIIVAFLTAAAGVVAISIAIVGFLNRRLNIVSRLVLLLGGVLLMQPGIPLMIIGLLLCVGSLALGQERVKEQAELAERQKETNR